MTLVTMEISDADGALEEEKEAIDGLEDMRVQAVVVDHYMGAPLPSGALSGLPDSPCYRLAREVPVLRVFGATPGGQKALAHIHGIFPYFYFRPVDDDDAAFENAATLRALLPQIAKDIEMTAAAQQRDARGSNGRQRSRPNKMVAKLLVVQGTPFYGFHPKPRLFVQIFLYNPRVTQTVVQLLESGCVAERRFQPYEAHVPFHLQVLADYNIEGMNFVQLSNIKFRAPVPDDQPHFEQPMDSGEFRRFRRSNVLDDQINGISLQSTVDGRRAPVPETRSVWYDRQSTCALEVDVAAASILNPRRFNALQRSLHGTNDFRNVPSLAAIWEEERLRRIRNGEKTTPDIPASVQRHEKASTTPTPSEPPPSALLSQSLFLKKLQKSVETVVDAMQQQLDAVAIEEAHVEEAVTTCNNSISTQSAFSFSQLEDEDQGSDKAKEDEAIVQILLAMQEAQPQHLASEHGSDDERHIDDDVATDEEENENPFRQDEIADILATQRVVDGAEVEAEVDGEAETEVEPAGTTAEKKWWEVGQTEPSSSTAESFIDELGSPRLVLHKQSRQTHGKRAQADKGGQRGSRADGSPIVGDIEDLLPPRPQVLIDSSSLEESEPIDDTALSLTPQPTPRGKRLPVKRRSLSPGNGQRRLWMFSPKPPTIHDLEQSSMQLGIDPVQHRAAFYSRQQDAPDRPMVFGGRKLEIPVRIEDQLPPFDTSTLRRKLTQDAAAHKWSDSLRQMRVEGESSDRRYAQEKVHRVRTPLRLPPDVKAVTAWLADNQKPAKSPRKRQRRSDRALISGSEESQAAGGAFSSAHMLNVTILSIEVFAASRGKMLPDALRDQVNGIFYSVRAQEGPGSERKEELGVLLQQEEHISASNFRFDSDSSVCIEYAASERELLARLEVLVHRWDPDFLTGFEVQKGSLGYLVDRASQLGVNLIQSLSRLPTTRIDARNPQAGYNEVDSGGEASIGTAWGVNKASGMWIHGRHILNLWRMARSELKLQRYAFEDVAREVLRREYPVYSPEQLTTWFQAGGSMRWKVARYSLLRAALNVRILSKMQLITRTSAMARLFGIDFYSVLSRGSQYRVEAVMLRVTKRRNFLMISPNRTGVAGQAPMECIPLVMEPQSSFYADPVVVLDFQSLYPSLVIGYNLCYSTLLGRLKDGLHPEIESSLGVTHFAPSAEGLVNSRDGIVIAPNGTLFCPKSYRTGVLPVILDEILSTRIMVKQAMKVAKKAGRERLVKVLDARQLALKMIANVTYGYTAAGFSGRMPCAQLADAIVQSGRCTLEAAVRLVESSDDWNAKVVYGDSVVGDTPIIIKRIAGGVETKELVPIEELDDRYEPSNGGKECVDCTNENVYVMTEAGYSKIVKVIRHRTSKKLFRVTTDIGSVIVTEGHSLLDSKKQKIKPEDCKIGIELLHWDFSTPETDEPTLSIPLEDTPIDIAFVKGVFFRDGSCERHVSPSEAKHAFVLKNQSIPLLNKCVEIFNAHYSDVQLKVMDTIKSSGVYEAVAMGNTAKLVSEWRDQFYSSRKLKKVPSDILNGARSEKLAFMQGCFNADGVKKPTSLSHKGQIGAQGLYLLLLDLEYDVSTSVRDDNPLVYRLSFTMDKQRCKVPTAVKQIEEIGECNGYVYDLETESHHFAAGVGQMVVHNTDSLFVLLKGRSKADAFRIGQEIADAVTSSNPKPVTLKLEKVYMGCILVSKKRYVGYKFESAAQEEGKVESKGIETVRRDSCGVVQTAMRDSLSLLFRTSDLSKVKHHLRRYWMRMLDDQLPLRDFIFAKEVRLGTYSDGSAPPAALVSTKAMTRDPRAEPRYAERVSYVVVNGPPGARLMDLVVSPDEIVDRSNKLRYSINYQYYIHKQILPSLERLFLLMGVNVRSWYNDLPKSAVKARSLAFQGLDGAGRLREGRSIDSYYLSKHCRLCGQFGTDSLCAECAANPQRSLFALHTASSHQEQALHCLTLACNACGDRDSFRACVNTACPVWNRIRLVESEQVTL